MSRNLSTPLSKGERIRSALLCLKLLLVCLLSWPLLQVGHAAEEAGFPIAVVRVVDQAGKVQSLRTLSRWIWTKANPGDPIERPYLRTWIEFPRDTAFISWTRPKAYSVSRLLLKPSDSPFASSTGLILSVDAETPAATVTLTLNRAGQVQIYSVIVQVGYDKPLNWLHSTCSGFNIAFTQRMLGSKYLYNAAYCRKVPGALEIFLEYSPDALWKLPNQIAIQAAGTGWQMVRIPDADRVSVSDKSLGWYRVGSARTRDYSEHEIFYQAPAHATASTQTSQPPPPTPKRFVGNFGVGFTYMNYVETPTGINLNEVGVTPKGAATLRIIPGKLSASVNGFLTLLPIFHTPATIESGQVLGANVRVGYQLPVHWADAEWTVSTGWYFWGLVTPSHLYGVDLLSGPQILFSLNKIWRPGKSMFAYLRYAPITDGLSAFQFLNADIALGAGYQLPLAWFHQPWTLTLDLARMAFASSTTLNTALIYSGTLGIQMSFP